MGVIGVQSMQKQTLESSECSLLPFYRRESRYGEVGGMSIMGVIVVQFMQKHTV